MTYVGFSLIATVFFAIGQVVNKLASKHTIRNGNSLMAFFMLSLASCVLLLAPFVPWVLPSASQLGLLIALTLTFLAGFYCFYQGVGSVDASTIAPLFQLQAGLVAVLAFLFLGERFAPINYAVLVVMIVGALLVTYNQSLSLHHFLSRGMSWLLLMQVFHASSNVLVGLALHSLAPLQILFWENVIVAILLPFFVWWSRPPLAFTPRQIAPIFLATYSVSTGVVALFTAYQSNLTISSVLGMLSSPLVFVFSLLASRFAPNLLKHHSTKVYAVRGVGLVLILLSAIKISLG